MQPAGMHSLEGKAGKRATRYFLKAPQWTPLARCEVVNGGGTCEQEKCASAFPVYDQKCMRTSLCLLQPAAASN